MSTNLISGLSSGFDWRSMVDQLIAIDRRRVTIIEKNRNTYQSQLSEWRSFNTKLLSLKTAAEGLRQPENFISYRSSMTSDSSTVKASDLISLSTSSSAAPGSYTITVEQTAAAQRISSGSFESASDALGLTGDILLNGVVVTLKETDSLSAVRTKINNAGTGVTASIVSYESDDHRMTLTSSATGADGISLGGELLEDFNFAVISEGRDAQLSIDGVAITRSSNAIEGVIEGVTVNLLKADSDTTVTITVEQDTSAVMSRINSFVSAFNAVATYINDQRAYNEETGKTGGVLFGDGTLASVRNDLVNTVLRPVIGVSSEFSLLNFAGITLNEKGLLTVDGTALAGHLKNNFDDIVNLFAVQGMADGADLEFIYGTTATAGGTYDISIIQAATQGSVTGTVDLTGGLDGNVTLSLSVGGYRAIVDLQENMTTGQIVEAINTELGTARTEIRVGSEKLYQGPGEATAITAETTWEQVYVGEESAGLADGAVISFSGTNHGGQTVSGRYEITDISTDTVQGLLAAVETAYGSAVTASIDAEGRIVIESTEEGRSRLSLTFDMADAGSLSFGDIGISDDGADGSRQGRGALALSASDDGSGFLVLTHDDYGSGAAFTIEQFGPGSLGLEEATYQGLDVAGTINGQEATGSGQVLTGAAGAVEGLSIRYTGDDAREQAGTVTFITGVAEQFSRTLSVITDPVGGYVAFKRESLGNAITAQEAQIERVNELLNFKAQRMIDRFVAMEVALSRMQNQSDWLTGQINAVYSGWQFKR